MTDAPRHVVAVIPAHDEEGTVADVVRGALPHVAAVIVVDDGSSDGTGARAADAGARVLRLEPNRGKGGALRAGIDAARGQGATHVITLDADGEHDPEDLPAFLAALADADLVLGWRDQWRSPARRFLNALSLFWFRLLDPRIRDTICGFRAFRVEALDALRADSGGFVYEHEVILRAVAARLRLVSVPVRVHSRRRSHVTAAEIVRANNHFDRWVLRRLGSLPTPWWRKVVLAFGCVAGLIVGTPAALLLGARSS